MTEITTRRWEGITCEACGEKGTYWEDRQPVHDSMLGWEIRAAGIEHSDGRIHEEAAVSHYPHLHEEIMKLLDDCVCTKHPPDWDQDTLATNIIAAAEQHMEWKS